MNYLSLSEETSDVSQSREPPLHPLPSEAGGSGLRVRRAARPCLPPTVHRAYCPSSHPISADTITTVCASEQQPEEIYDCYRWRRFVAHILCPASCNENTINTVITPLILVCVQVFRQFSHSKNVHAFL